MQTRQPQTNDNAVAAYIYDGREHVAATIVNTASRSYNGRLTLGYGPVWRNVLGGVR